MNKNRFSIIIINEKTKFNFSISLSHISVKLISLFSVLIGIYIIFAFIQSYNKQTEKEQLAYIYNQQNNLMNIIKYLKKENLINDSIIYEYNLDNTIDNYNTLLPVSKPVDGIITKGIIANKKTPHNGIDIAAPFKSRIKAIQAGIVILSDKLPSLGNTIIIAHPNNYFSLYAHMHQRLVHTRDIIKNNDIIGLVGEAKKGDGPHLHFEIWHNNLIIDPRNLIEEYKLNDVSIKK